MGAVLEGKGSHESWHVCKDSILQAQEQVIPKFMKTSRPGDQLGKAEDSWQSSTAKRQHTGGGSTARLQRMKLETFSRHEGMVSGNLKHNWSCG